MIEIRIISSSMHWKEYSNSPICAGAYRISCPASYVLVRANFWGLLRLCPIQYNDQPTNHRKTIAGKAAKTSNLRLLEVSISKRPILRGKKICERIIWLENPSLSSLNITGNVESTYLIVTEWTVLTIGKPLASEDCDSRTKPHSSVWSRARWFWRRRLRRLIHISLSYRWIANFHS